MVEAMRKGIVSAVVKRVRMRRERSLEMGMVMVGLC